MANIDLYKEVFTNTFEIAEDQLAGLEYQAVPAWDSVGHMELVAQIEDVFDIMMDADDIIDLSSFEKGIEILKANYDVEF